MADKKTAKEAGKHISPKSVKRAKKATSKKPRKMSPNSLANLKPFQPGNSGNPTGKPRGLRNAVSQDFLSDMLRVWNEENDQGYRRGYVAIRLMAAKNPAKFVAAMGNLVPREISLDDETQEGFAGIWAMLAKASASKDE